LTLSSNGTIYVADTSNYRIMQFLPGEPRGYVVAGGRGSGVTLDKIGTSYGVDIDSQGNIYVSEYGNHRITKWSTPASGVIVCYLSSMRY